MKLFLYLLGLLGLSRKETPQTKEETALTKRNAICFAYFADDNFVGWWGGTFGPVSLNAPKIYGDDAEQIQIITNNFRNKIAAINKSSFDQEKDKTTSLGGALSLIKFSGEDELRGKKVQLKIVKCPIYDGPNPDYSKEAFLAWHKANTGAKFSEAPHNCQSWIYADYEQVKAWAANAPKEFELVIEA